MKIKNAKTLPKVYYGLHMVEGVAEYADPSENDGLPYRIFLGESVLKNMDTTFQGRPVFVHHVDNVNLSTLEQEAAGYVVKSFFNQADGKYWAQFIVTSDAGHEAIAKGWKLSNAYMPKQYSAGGKWHNVEYSKEVMEGEYDHLAIVPNPRYEESIILTPEEFKAYNSEREAELKLLANSKGESKMGLKFFKRTKVENAVDLESTIVELKSGKQLSISDLVKNAEDMEEKKANEEKEAKEGKYPMANGDHMVKVGEHEMSVNELIAKHQELMEKHKDDDGSDETENEGEGADEMHEHHENDEDEEAAKKAKELEEHEKKEIAEKKKNAKEKAAKLKNAGPSKETLPVSMQRNDDTIELPADRAARGKARYGRE